MPEPTEDSDLLTSDDGPVLLEPGAFASLPGEGLDDPAELPSVNRAVPHQTGLPDTLLAILFACARPVRPEEAATALDLPVPAVRQAMEVLGDRLTADGPFQLVEIQEGWQLATKAEFAADIAAFLKPEPHRLSRSMLETLAVVAYRQPITSSEIDEIRGVQSDYSVKALCERGLVQDVGRRQTVGRPILYGTTPNFLHHFKLKDLSQLPELQPALPFVGDDGFDADA